VPKLEARAPTVGVVIPTQGRSTLRRAVDSVLRQSYPPTQILVVVDGPVDLLREWRPDTDERVRVLTNPARSGAAAARNSGIRLLTTSLVALLDDDDEWEDDKLAQQVSLFQSMCAKGVQYPLIACRSLMEDTKHRRIAVAPRRLIRPGQPIADYLFRRRTLIPYRVALGASMLLFPRELALKQPFGEDVLRHDDWDWLLRVTALPGTELTHAPNVLLRYSVGAHSSSGRPGWRESIDWVNAHRHFLSRHEQADFLLCITSAIAIRHRDWLGVRLATKAAWQRGRSSPQAWMFLLLLIARAVTCDWLVRAGWHDRYRCRLACANPSSVCARR